MQSSRTYTRTLASFVLGGYLLALLSPATLALAPSYSESYYITLDTNGTPQAGDMVKCIQRNGASEFVDHGDYTNVHNMTTPQQTTVQEKTVHLAFSQNDPATVYFEGQTTAPLQQMPWRTEIAYLLNGVPKEASELAGQKGLVEIRVHLIPNRTAPAYLQNNLIATCSTLLDSEQFLSIEAQGAQVQVVGSKRLVLWMALPGQECTFTLRLGADAFSFPGFYMMMSPVTLSQLDQISELRKAKEQTEQAGKDLSRGMDTLLGTMQGMQSVMEQTAQGLDAVNNARAVVSSEKGKVYASGDAVLGSMGDLQTSMQKAGEHLTLAQQILHDTNEKTGNLVATLRTVQNDTKQARSSLESLQKSIRQLQDMAKDINQQNHNTHALLTGYEQEAQQVYSDLQKLKASIQRLHDLLHSMGKHALGAMANPPSLSIDGADGMLTPLVGAANQSATEATQTWEQVVSYGTQMLPAVTSMGQSVGEHGAVWTALDTLKQYLSILEQYHPTAEDILDAALQGADTLQSLSTTLDTLINRIDDLQKMANTYEPKLQSALDDLKQTADQGTTGIQNLQTFLQTTKGVLQTSGQSLDQGAQQTLAGAAQTMRKAGQGFAQTGTIQQAKNSLQSVIEKQWAEHTGDVTNLLKLDTKAVPISLTSSQNPAPTSVQILLRTPAIDQAEDKQVPNVDETYHADGNFFTRVWSVFVEIGHSIGKLFGK